MNWNIANAPDFSFLEQRRRQNNQDFNNAIGNFASEVKQWKEDANNEKLAKKIQDDYDWYQASAIQNDADEKELADLEDKVANYKGETSIAGWEKGVDGTWFSPDGKQFITQEELEEGKVPEGTNIVTQNGKDFDDMNKRIAYLKDRISKNKPFVDSWKHFKDINPNDLDVALANGRKGDWSSWQNMRNMHNQNAEESKPVDKPADNDKEALLKYRKAMTNIKYKGNADANNITALNIESANIADELESDGYKDLAAAIRNAMGEVNLGVEKGKDDAKKAYEKKVAKWTEEWNKLPERRRNATPLKEYIANGGKEN